MTIAVAEKTWQVVPNVQTLGGGEHDHARRVLFQLKEEMTGFGSNPWTVDGMSDGTGASGMASGDLWAAWGDLLWNTAGNPHTWVVFGTANGAQILFDPQYTTSNCEDCWVEFSPGGLYVGGSATAAPTATDAVSVASGGLVMSFGSTGNPWWTGLATAGASSASATNLRHHYWLSTDGLVAYWQIWRLGVCVAMWQFGELSDARTGHTNSFTAGANVNNNGGSPVNILTVTVMADYRHLWTDIGGTKYQLDLYGVGATSNLWVEGGLGAVLEETDNELNVSDVSVFSDDVGARGPKGKLTDVWWTQYQYVSDGDTSPNDAGARDFTHTGCFMMPWTGDATVMLLS